MVMVFASETKLTRPALIELDCLAGFRINEGATAFRRCSWMGGFPPPLSEHIIGVGRKRWQLPHSTIWIGVWCAAGCRTCLILCIVALIHEHGPEAALEDGTRSTDDLIGTPHPRLVLGRTWDENPERVVRCWIIPDRGIADRDQKITSSLLLRVRKEPPPAVQSYPLHRVCKVLGARPYVSRATREGSEFGCLPEVIHDGIVRGAVEEAPREVGPVQEQSSHPATHGVGQMRHDLLWKARCLVLAQLLRHGADRTMPERAYARVQRCGRWRETFAGIPCGCDHLRWDGAMTEPAMLLPSLIFPAHRSRSSAPTRTIREFRGIRINDPDPRVVSLVVV